MANQHTDEMREERRLKKPAFNGCVREGRGEYCQPCVAMATNYEYTGETDRRKKPHKYAPFTPDVNFEEWYNNNCTVDLDLTSAKLGWAGATTRYQNALREIRMQIQRIHEYDPTPNYQGATAGQALAAVNKLLGEK
jgi:hypothetical protein